MTAEHFRRTVGQEKKMKNPNVPVRAHDAEGKEYFVSWDTIPEDLQHLIVDTIQYHRERAHGAPYSVMIFERHFVVAA
jgi:hypothetical protein